MIFFTDSRFFRGKDGAFYNISGGLPASLWERYLRYFKSVVIVARCADMPNEEGIPAYKVPAPNVSVHPIPYYHGIKQYAKTAFRFRREIKKAIEAYRSDDTAFLCRLPARTASCAASVFRRKKIPYGVEVGGDPWDVFAPGTTNIPFRAFIRYESYRRMRADIAGASVALYVTRETLQKRYPPCEGAFVGTVSNVVLPPCRIAVKPKKKARIDGVLKIVSVGTLEQMYKAPDILLKALAIAASAGIVCELDWAGDGRFRPEMEMLAKNLGLENRVVWHGRVPQNVVDELLSGADIFVMASRTEGLPRALIEAMAKGLPCIGTRVGGIPELLDDCVLIPPDNESALADKIIRMAGNIDFMNAQAKRNWQEAKKYEQSVLNAVRDKAFSFLKKCYEK